VRRAHWGLVWGWGVRIAIWIGLDGGRPGARGQGGRARQWGADGRPGVWRCCTAKCAAQLARATMRVLDERRPDERTRFGPSASRVLLSVARRGRGRDSGVIPPGYHTHWTAEHQRSIMFFTHRLLSLPLAANAANARPPVLAVHRRWLVGSGSSTTCRRLVVRRSQSRRRRRLPSVLL
jgi:hypothetical protein